MSIIERGMLVNVTISLWDGRRLDRKASRKATEDNHANDERALRVSKGLVADDALKPCVTTAGSIRRHLTTVTLPWRDKGARLLPNDLYFKFIKRHGELEQAYLETADDFCFKVYPQEIDRASFRLGATFDPGDYETPERLRKRFSVHLDIDAINDPNDFRVKMDADVVEQIKADIQEKTERRIQDAMSHVWERAEKTITHFAESMRTQADWTEGTKRPQLYNTTLTHVQELVDLLPAMNIMSDKNIDKLCKRLQATVAGYDIKALKGKPENCETAATEVESLLEDFSGIFTAMRGSDND